MYQSLSIGGWCSVTRIFIMKNRKRIAVIMCDVHHTYQQRILKGIIQQAHALNYDVAVFTMFMNFDEETNYQYGENNVFKLINYDLFDAVIYAPCSVGKRALREFFADSLKNRCKVPIIALEFEDPLYHNVIVDDVQCFDDLVSHLIELHHFQDIICLTGFKDNLQAEARLKGYKRAMRRHNLPLLEENMLYGDFWIAAALDLAQKLASGERRMPEAIVCVSDFVAVSLCNRLIELGVKVPEDVVIAGYDVTKESSRNVPSITSYARPLTGMGAQAVLLVHRLLTGEEASPAVEDNGYLVTAESCGCGEDFSLRLLRHQKRLKTTTDYQDLFNCSHMAESLNSAKTLNTCLERIAGFLYLIRGMNDFYLCLCDAWDDFERNENNGNAYKEYTDTMRLRIKVKDCSAMIVDEPFDRSLLLPAMYEESEIPRVWYFTPLHFNERCFGYAALGYGNNPLAFDQIYHAWSRNINNALEFVRMRNIYNSMHQRLYMASIRDTLTGVFNRKGFKRYSAEMFAKSINTGKQFLVIAADLDCLKPINDTYGHLEGDNAITVTANALNTCLTNGEICARTGGDEFVAVGCADYTEEMIAQYLQHIEQYIQRYNASSEKPYEVGASFGYICRTVTENDDLQAILDEADARMYENKVRRKKNRK